MDDEVAMIRGCFRKYALASTKAVFNITVFFKNKNKKLNGICYITKEFAVSILYSQTSGLKTCR